MKKLLVLIVVIAGALLAFNYFTTGEFKLFPGSSMNEQEQELNRLRGEFRAAAQEYRQAGRGAALGGGMDTTHAAEAALAAVDRVEKELKALRKEADQDVQEEIDDLLREIGTYKKNIS